MGENSTRTFYKRTEDRNLFFVCFFYVMGSKEIELMLDGELESKEFCNIGKVLAYLCTYGNN